MYDCALQANCLNRACHTHCPYRMMEYILWARILHKKYILHFKSFKSWLNKVVVALHSNFLIPKFLKVLQMFCMKLSTFMLKMFK